MGLRRFIKCGWEMRSLPFKRRWGEWLQLAFMAVLVLIMIITPGFFTWDNLIRIVNQVSLIAILSCGITLLMSSGNFDLSVGSAVAVSNMTCALILQKTSNVILALTGAVLSGLVTGAVNGLFVGCLSLPSFFVTLGTQVSFRGIAYVIGGGASIYGIRKMNFISQGTFFKLPINIVILIITAFTIQFLLLNTLFGRYLLAIGHSRTTAKNIGISVRKNVFISYLLIGFLVGIVGVLFTARTNCGQPSAASSYEYDTIIASILGGVSLTGGKGFIIGAVFGAVLWGLLENLMNYIGILYFYQRVIKGLIILFVLLKDQDIQRGLSQWKK
ncbi:MAG: ABC transporter permease [Clostridiaceae bacterium]|nr:ABC transporter permease [Clostridiaceae bacterium]